MTLKMVKYISKHRSVSNITDYGRSGLSPPNSSFLRRGGADGDNWFCSSGSSLQTPGIHKYFIIIPPWWRYSFLHAFLNSYSMSWVFQEIHESTNVKLSPRDEPDQISAKIHNLREKIPISTYIAVVGLRLIQLVPSVRGGVTFLFWG